MAAVPLRPGAILMAVINAGAESWQVARSDSTSDDDDDNDDGDISPTMLATMIARSKAKEEATRLLTEKADETSEATSVEGDSTLKCRICIERPLCIVFVPCNHQYTCRVCSVQLLNCPVCRANIEAYIPAIII